MLTYVVSIAICVEYRSVDLYFVSIAMHMFEYRSVDYILYIATHVEYKSVDLYIISIATNIQNIGHVR